MSDNTELALLTSALGAMGTSSLDAGPLPLLRELLDAARKRRLALVESGARHILQEILSEDENSPARNVFTRSLIQWDHVDAVWAGGNAPNTVERRSKIYDLLDVPPAFRERCDHLIPARLDVEEPAVIAEDHADWYTPERKTTRCFFWNAYRRYLQGVNHWPEESIIDLDRSTDLIVERLSDPERKEVYQTKGLVVGYVQSGKTANFTAVIAKAADAGYRLIIVLAGTLDILREQTQRRLDRELIGKELIGTAPPGEPHDYAHDTEWASFIAHGGLPSTLGAFDWQRLTGSKDEYQSLRRGIDALEFHKVKNGRRLNDPVNLHSQKARLVVLKKHPAVLKRLVRDLTAIRARLDEVPALVIDDESDQASVNTVKPGSSEDRKRTSTNAEIVRLLSILPRAQYIGYTATPFANVFVDPADAEDLFPKDYILPLGRPSGYMGVSDFFDFEIEKPEGYKSNERAFVRDVKGEDTESSNLQTAIDSFVLAGAIKLFREKRGHSFRHHTMLVHRSHKMSEHTIDKALVEEIWRGSGYRTKSGITRLEKLCESDFKPVHRAREPGLPFPTSFELLRPLVATCVDRIEAEPVGIVNGDLANRDQTPNFDRESVWRILVGGTKLSRGYTVEGLTISYYRRLARNADTLMQMGRWFGFRRGYRDLVRLFIGRHEPDGVDRGEPDGVRRMDLYRAFRAICLDEEDFRQELRRYSRERNPRIKPRQIPPLVPSHLLRPTARNKMYNAILAAQNLGEQWKEVVLSAITDRDIRENDRATRRLLEVADFLRSATLAVRAGEGQWRAQAHLFRIDAGSMLEFLRMFRWSVPNLFESAIEFMNGGMGDPGIQDWLIVAPQTRTAPMGTWHAAGKDLNVVERARDDGDRRRFKAFSEPRHRYIAEAIAGIGDTQPNPSIVELSGPGRGVMLLYPCRESNQHPISIGFALLFPKNQLVATMKFVVADPSRPDAVVVDRPAPESLSAPL